MTQPVPEPSSALAIWLAGLVAVALAASLGLPEARVAEAPASRLPADTPTSLKAEPDPPIVVAPARKNAPPPSRALRRNELRALASLLSRRRPHDPVP